MEDQKNNIKEEDLSEVHSESKPEESEEASEVQSESKPEESEEASEVQSESKPEESEETSEVQSESKKKSEHPKNILDKIDEFRPGDNITVNLRIIEGTRQRTQAFQGNVIKGRFIKKKPPVVSATFIVRKITSGIGVERIFPYYSPSIESVKLNRKGKVKQARIYYLRERSGRSARIKERRT